MHQSQGDNPLYKQAPSEARSLPSIFSSQPSCAPIKSDPRRIVRVVCRLSAGRKPRAASGAETREVRALQGRAIQNSTLGADRHSERTVGK